MFRYNLKSNFYTSYILTKKSLKEFIKHKPSIITQLEKYMSDDMTGIYSKKNSLEYKFLD